jgi:hypothetical protein
VVDLARVTLVVVAFALVGCFGDDEPSRSPEETAHAWVTAINAGDYERACELSVVDDQAGCVELLAEEPFGERIRVEGFESDSFGISSREDRNPRGRGWTAYAPLSGFDIERHDGEYLVHWEISIIR